MAHYCDHYLGGGVYRHPDFTKKICALRELFEECNILVAADNQRASDIVKETQGTKLRDTYLHDFDSNFIKFCKNLNLYP